jgi:hypothetical protein
VKLATVTIGSVLLLLLLLLLAPAAAQPSCITRDDLERVRKLMLDAIDQGFKQHAMQLFDNWLRDPNNQPARAQRGMRIGVKAYLGTRAATLRWAPPTCP